MKNLSARRPDGLFLCKTSLRVFKLEVINVKITFLLYNGVAIDPTCIKVGRLERTQPNLIHFGTDTPFL